MSYRILQGEISGDVLYISPWHPLHKLQTLHLKSTSSTFFRAQLLQPYRATVQTSSSRSRRLVNVVNAVILADHFEFYRNVVTFRQSWWDLRCTFRGSSDKWIKVWKNRAKCLPILLYATEACPLLSRNRSSFEFTVTRLFTELFCTTSPAVVKCCQFAQLPTVHSQIDIRIANHRSLLHPRTVYVISSR